MSYQDMRDFLNIIDKKGELKHLHGVDWNLEMATIAELVYNKGKVPQPVLLFDEIPGYPKGYSCLFGLLTSPRRIAMALGLPDDKIDRKTILNGLRKKGKTSKLIPPQLVTSSPVDAHLETGDNIDLLKFPSPKFHELDGGRYLGTGAAVVQKDPDTGYVNLAAYRVMLVDKNRLAIHILEGQHGSMIMEEKYFKRGKVMPIAIAIGVDPVLWFAAGKRVPWQTSEYDYAGMLKGKPLEIFMGPQSGLPLPASAEIVIEGECHPDELIDEGPFAESCGYYANLGLEAVPEPVIHVTAVHYRDNPILTCAIPSVPPCDYSLMTAYNCAATLWDSLEATGIVGIKDVWCPEVGHGNMLQVISLDQKYSGHSVEVGVTASQCRLGGLCKYTIVVDGDIDPSDINQVMWAIETRTDPSHSIQFVEHCHSTSRDTTISPAEKRKYKVPPKPLYTSKCIIDACQPFEWKKEWYPVAIASPELRSKVSQKYGDVLKELL